MAMSKVRRRLRAVALASTMFVALGAVGASADERTYAFNIDDMTLSDALRVYARVTNQQIIFTDDLVAQHNAPVLKGAYGADEALQTLLKGTGLVIERAPSGAIMVRKPIAAKTQVKQRAAQAGEAAPAPEVPAAAADDAAPPAEKVTVTGSRIRGARQASPVIRITADDMRKQGHTDIGQALRALPQNFGGGQNPTVSMLGAGTGNQNISGGSALNLRGLGPDATLTLLNGTRLPYDGQTQATDAAAIPLAAIERMEILLDGASAIYGSDAVGGVANIVLKRDYDGAQISARWGKATQGGYEQQQYTGVAGTTWATGGFIVTADHSRSSDVEANQRDYLSYMPPNSFIYGLSKQQGVLFSGHQQILDNVELTVDAFYTRRTGHDLADLTPLTGFALDLTRDSIIWGIVPSLRFDLAGDWSLRVGGAAGQGKAKTRTDNVVLSTGTVLFSGTQCYCNDSESVSLDTEGPLFDLPGGEARGAFGGGYRGNEFDAINQVTHIEGEGKSYYVYGEVFLPLLSEEQNIPLVHLLSLSAAVRYEDYESFGETTTPKVGATWGLSPDLDLKATWGKSFKVPTLLQQFSPTRIDLGLAAGLGGSSFPAGSQALFIQGGNPGLTPEKAETLTAGFVVHPEFLPGFRLEASWFDVDYTDRVALAFNPITTALSNPAGFPFVTFNPTVAQQNAAFAFVGLPPGTFTATPTIVYNPAATVAIIDARYVNTAAQHFEGVDLLTSYTFDLFGGSFTASGNATWLDMTQMVTSASPEQTKTGFVFNPPEFRGRIGGSWTGDGLTVSATLNQTGGVINNLVAGSPKGDAFTTVDLVIDYVFESGPLGGELELTLGAQNLFDEDPPYMQPTQPMLVSYDSTNYTAFGRVVNFTVTQRY